MKHKHLQDSVAQYLSLNEDTASALFKTAKPYKIHIALSATKRFFNNTHDVPMPYKDDIPANDTMENRRAYFKKYYKHLKE